MQRLRRFGLATAVTVALLGQTPVLASDGLRSAGPVRSLLELRREIVIVQDWDMSCGAAALATLLTYQHGDPVSEREVAAGLIRREEYLANPEVVQLREGFSLLDLKRYAEERGYEGIGYAGLEFDHLIELAPIMVPVNFNGYNHFVIFRGVVGDWVVLADPAWGNRTVPVERFRRAWVTYPEFGNVGFVVARRDGAEPPNRLAPRLHEFPSPVGPVLQRVALSTGLR